MILVSSLVLFVALGGGMKSLLCSKSNERRQCLNSQSSDRAMAVLHLTNGIDIMYTLLASALVLADMQEEGVDEEGYLPCRVCSAKPVC